MRLTVNGQATAMSALEGKTVVTVEGLGGDAGDHPVQTAWAEANVPQCGSCQSGQTMAAALLKNKPSPTERDIDAR